MNTDTNTVNLSPAETDATFRRLRHLKASLRGVNANEKAITLISACILEGMNERKRILPAMEKLGFDWDHAAAILRHGTGPDPARHRWYCDEGEIYTLHAQGDGLPVM